MFIKCPECREPNVRLAHRRVMDLPWRLCGFVAIRCNLCDHRFYRYRRLISWLASIPRTNSIEP